MSGNRAAFSLATFFWPKIAPAFSAFATSLWLAAQKKVARLRVREPDLNNIAIAIHYYLFCLTKSECVTSVTTFNLQFKDQQDKFGGGGFPQFKTDKKTMKKKFPTKTLVFLNANHYHLTQAMIETSRPQSSGVCIKVRQTFFVITH